MLYFVALVIYLMLIEPQLNAASVDLKYAPMYRNNHKNTH
jgi:hypothetical protein